MEFFKKSLLTFFFSFTFVFACFPMNGYDQAAIEETLNTMDLGFLFSERVIRSSYDLFMRRTMREVLENTDDREWGKCYCVEFKNADFELEESRFLEKALEVRQRCRAQSEPIHLCLGHLKSTLNDKYFAAICACFREDNVVTVNLPVSPNLTKASCLRWLKNLREINFVGYTGIMVADNKFLKSIERLKAEGYYSTLQIHCYPLLS